MTMRTLAAFAALVLVAGVTNARAQEPGPRAQDATARAQDATAVPAEAPDKEATPRRHIQVLENPYDISSFYRSSQAGGAVDFGYEPSGASGRYPIAGFYRAGGASRGAYSMFWTSGYGTGRYGSAMRGLRGRGLLGPPRHRPLGLNGDLCLFAPTFLAPV